MSKRPSDIVLPSSWDRRATAEPLMLYPDSDPLELAKEGMRRLVVTNVPADVFQRYGELVTVVADESGSKMCGGWSSN